MSQADAVQRAFGDELRARRQAVVQRLPEDAAAARFVFALLTGAARAGHADLKPEAIEALATRQEPDLDAAVPAERQQEVYQAIYGWFGQNASAFTDSGADVDGPVVGRDCSWLNGHGVNPLRP